MHNDDANEFRIITGEFRILDEARVRGVALERDLRPRAIERQDRRRRALDRQMHAVVLNATKDGVSGGPFADWFFDLRRGRLRIYGALLRFIDLAHKTVPKSVLKLIPGWISAYIDDLYEGAES